MLTRNKSNFWGISSLSVCTHTHSSQIHVGCEVGNKKNMQDRLLNQKDSILFAS